MAPWVNIFSVISLLAGTGCVFLGGFVLARGTRSRLNIVFHVMALSIAVWAFSEFGMRNAVNLSSVEAYIKLYAFWPIPAALVTVFVQQLTGRGVLLSRWSNILLIYLPALVFAILRQFDGFFVSLPLREWWGWTINTPFYTPMAWVRVIWALALTITSLYYCVDYLRRTTDPRQVRQTKWVFYCVIVYILAMTFDQTVSRFNLHVPEIATIVAGVLGYAIIRFRLFTLSPESAAQEIVSAMTDGLLLVNPAGKVVAANRACLRLLGLAYEKDLLGRQVDSVLAASNENLLPLDIAYMLRSASANPVTDLEANLLRARGGPVPVSLSISIQRGERNEVEGLVCVARDLTERKQAEARQRDLYEREKDLRHKLETEIERRIVFTRSLVHELRTPLTAVIASSELLMDEIREGVAATLAANVHRAAQNLNRRIDELLDLARGETGVLAVNVMDTDLGPMLRELHQQMQPVAHGKRQELVLEMPEKLEPVCADDNRLRQVILNYLSNAFKFTPEGGRILIRVTIPNNQLVVEVIDTGKGIPIEEQAYIFDPAKRRRRESAQGGLGLGLALSKTLVELHGGQVWVRSEEGRGSTFGFSLPLANKESVSGPQFPVLPGGRAG
jgi:PAS domain S-box-containing protein